MIASIAKIRDAAVANLSPSTQQQLEQFLTPISVAEQAVSLFTQSDQSVSVLDLGSGTGILSAVTLEHSPQGSAVVAVEQDPHLAQESRRTLSSICDDVTVINSSVFEVLLDSDFDRVILNPPYKKIKPTIIATSSGGVRVTNLYAAFVINAIQSLRVGGECVAIIPRSWMNGEYFKDFRKWLLSECSVDAIAVYGSRQDHFKDLNILQEIMLLKLSKRGQCEQVVVYKDIAPSDELSENDAEHVPFTSLILGKEQIIRIEQQDSRLSGFNALSDQGLWVSTGKLVWFRNRDLLVSEAQPHTYPLYWADNQVGIRTEHPVETDREQWVNSTAERRNILLPAGSYCLVNRFSAKEQERRIHASYVKCDSFFAADNKLNYIHQGTSRRTIPLEQDVARGLALWLSTTIVDQWYRQVSGSTQVNATDLRQLPCPTQRELIMISKALPSDQTIEYDVIDTAVGELFSWAETNSSNKQSQY